MLRNDFTASNWYIYGLLKAEYFECRNQQYVLNLTWVIQTRGTTKNIQINSK